ncbi:MAG TPA: cob(I)yrinic acid a,c-diamide adenosyltransferase [Candidatus Limnocylindria bacterium]
MSARRRPSARVTTRTGDRGETSLFGKPRVRKTDPRIEALGDLDEAQAAIGVARSLAGRSGLALVLLELQRGLYTAMSEVATPPEDLRRLPQRLDATAVKALDDAVERVKADAPVEGRFVIPGEDALSAAIDHARAIARRAERRVVACADAGLLSPDVLLPWLNRLSDLLFVLARAHERRRRPANATAQGVRKRTR